MTQMGAGPRPAPIAAGAIHTTVGLRNLSATTCTVKGVPGAAARRPESPGDGAISPRRSSRVVLVAAWVGGDRAAAGSLAGLAVTERLFRQSPPAHPPAAEPRRLVPTPAVYVCSYPLELAALSVFIEGGASAGYSITGGEFGD